MPSRYLTIVTCMVFSWCSAQVNVAETSLSLQTANEGLGLLKSFDNRSKQPNGSSRVFETYVPGGIIMNNNEFFQVRQMNYDGYSDAVIVVYNKEERVVATDMVKAFYVVDLTDTIFFDRLLNKNNQIGYYQRLVVGRELRLYKKPSIKLQPATYSGGYSTGTTQAEFISNFTYYVWSRQTIATEFKTKKDLAKLFPTEKEKLEQYLKDHKTDFKVDQDVAALIQYLDLILTEKE